MINEEQYGNVGLNRYFRRIGRKAAKVAVKGKTFNSREEAIRVADSAYRRAIMSISA